MGLHPSRCYEPMSDEYDHTDSIGTSADVIADEYNPDVDELPELVFEEADQSIYTMSADRCLSLLRQSPNGPQEWSHLVGDADGWRDVIRAMAFSAYRVDLWDELRDRGIEQ